MILRCNKLKQGRDLRTPPDSGIISADTSVRGRAVLFSRTSFRNGFQQTEQILDTVPMRNLASLQ